MNKLLSAGSELLYASIAKPMLFKVQPDRVHSGMIRTASVLQRWPVVRASLRGAWAYDDNRMLEQTVRGLRFRNPIGLSAGFDKNFEMVPMMHSIGFGFMEGGSVTSKSCAGNPRPWFYRLPRSKSLVVHAGLANQGVKVIAGRIRSYPSEILQEFPLNISVAQTNTAEVADEDAAIADVLDCLRHIKRSGVGNMVTVNISCPNTYQGEPFTSPRMLERLLTGVDGLSLSQPLFIKMPNHLPWRDFSKLLTVANRHSVSGVTVSNLANRETGVQLADPLPDAVPGGLSGKPTWERSNELIRRTYQRYGDRFTIIGVGGVFSAEDAYTKIRLGATLVELITGMIFEGPQLIGRINRDLTRLLARDGFTNVSQAIGVDTR